MLHIFPYEGSLANVHVRGPCCQPAQQYTSVCSAICIVYIIYSHRSTIYYERDWKASCFVCKWRRLIRIISGNGENGAFANGAEQLHKMICIKNVRVMEFPSAWNNFKIYIICKSFICSCVSGNGIGVWVNGLEWLAPEGRTHRARRHTILSLHRCPRNHIFEFSNNERTEIINIKYDCAQPLDSPSKYIKSIIIIVVIPRTYKTYTAAADTRYGWRAV